MSEARKRLQEISNELFEELAADVYDEVDRRETDASKYRHYNCTVHMYTACLRGRNFSSDGPILINFLFSESP